MRTLAQRLYAPALVISLPVAFVVYLVPVLGVLLALFWLLAPQWLLAPYRRAQAGSLPHLELFLQRWTRFLRWAPWLYWFMIVMWTVFVAAAWLSFPEEPGFKWFTPFFAGLSLWLLWRIFRVYRIPIAEMDHLLPVSRAVEPRLWQEIESVAALLGVRPPASLAFDWGNDAAVIFEPVLAAGNQRLEDPVLVLGGVGFEAQSRLELRAAIAHELAHLRHKDHRILALHSRASTWAYWASHVHGRLSVGEDTAELWQLIADYPYELDLHLNPLRQQVELHCDRAAAGVTSPETAAHDLLRTLLLAPRIERVEGALDIVWGADWKADLDALADGAHPTMSQRSKALGVDQAKLRTEIESQPLDGSAESFLDQYPVWREALIDTHAWRFDVPDESDDEGD